MTDVSATGDRRVVQLSWAILVANLAVAVAKLAFGALYGSLAIKADGFHSLLDGVNNVVIILAVKIAAKPADANHPYGHRKFEVLASLFIGFMFAMMVVRIVGDAVNVLIHGTEREIDAAAYVVVVVTLVVNAAVAIGEHFAGRRWQSALLMADARHTMSDVLVSSAVLLGIFLSRRGVSGADAVSALLVAGIVAWVGYGIVRPAIAGLSDEAVLPVADIVSAVKAVPGVVSVERVRSRRYGQDVQIDLAVGVDGAMSLRVAHDIADVVERTLKTQWPAVSEVVVHVEPTT